LSTIGFGVPFGLFGGGSSSPECKIRHFKWLAIFPILHEFDWPCAQSECSYMHHAEIVTAYPEKWSEIGQWPAVILHSAPLALASIAFRGWMVNLKAVLHLSLGPALTKARVRRVVSMSVSPGYFCAATLSLNFMLYASHGIPLNW